MFRHIIGVVIGYVVMAVLVIAAFAVSLAIPDFAFEKDRFEVTSGWLVYALVTSLIAGIVGGFVATRIARRRTASYTLALLAFVLGMGSAVDNLKKERPAETESPAGLSAMDRAAKTVQPNWYAFTLPLVGMTGIVIGGRLRRQQV